MIEKVRTKKKRSNNSARFRQHVNPLARQYQQPTLLSETWPLDVFDDCSKPLHLDIGCGKGGFLLDMAGNDTTVYNYLGLEIRPLVAQYAKDRIQVHDLQSRLDFIGCNANVDLERLLTRYLAADAAARLERVSIQFPDPHFKAPHAKRRVVDDQLVAVVATHLSPTGTVFLQSDVQSVLDAMRERFAACSALVDATPGEYYPDNLYAIPTEREMSVLDQGLPVYRALFTKRSM